MGIREIPNDLGIALDKMIDGTADGTKGNFLYIPDPGIPTPTAWPSAEVVPVPGSEARLKLPF